MNAFSFRRLRWSKIVSVFWREHYGKQPYYGPNRYIPVISTIVMNTYLKYYFNH